MSSLFVVFIPLSLGHDTLSAVRHFSSKSDMGRPKFLGRVPKAGTGKNKRRKRAQVAQYRSRVNDRPNSEASPPTLTTTTPAVSSQCPPHVVSCPVMATTAPLTRKITLPQPLSYNKSVIDFDTIPSSEPVDTADAFKYNSKGEERLPATMRKAKSRASNIIVNAILSCADNPNDRTAALAAALAHPDIQGITKNVGMTDPKTSEMMSNVLNQQRRIIKRTSETVNTRGRSGDQKRSLVESVFVSMAPSPNQNAGNRKRPLIEAMGIPLSTGYRLMANAETKRRRLSENIDSVSWSNVQSRKGYSKVSPAIRSKFLEWFMNHPNVVESPITNETLLIHNLVTGQKERVSKLLLQISIRELHNDMLLPPDEGGFKEAWDETGNVRISDTALRALLPEQARKVRFVSKSATTKMT